MSATRTLPQVPADPSPTRPPARRTVAILGVVALVAVAILALAYAAGWFDSTEHETTTPVEQDVVPEPSDDVVPDPLDNAGPEPSDDAAPDRPDDTTPTPRYREELRANWDVTGVAASDVLNVRNGPGATFPIVATLAHDAAEFESTGRIAEVGDQLWREIIVPGDGVGWVNAAYLTETG